MAKIAQCRYGSKGTGPSNNPTKTYSYVVNDNVRTQDVIQVVSTSHGLVPRKFATTAQVKNAYKEDSKEGAQAKAEAMADNGGEELTKSYTATELGIPRTVSRKKPTESPIEGLKPQSENVLQARAGNLKMYAETHEDTNFTENAYQTFEEYSRPYMGKDIRR